MKRIEIKAIPHTEDHFEEFRNLISERVKNDRHLSVTMLSAVEQAATILIKASDSESLGHAGWVMAVGMVGDRVTDQIAEREGCDVVELARALGHIINETLAVGLYRSGGKTVH